eukprot:COSAG04_NODE_8704_length_941_cov_1.030879_3_plen_126_part_00
MSLLVCLWILERWRKKKKNFLKKEQGEGWSSTRVIGGTRPCYAGAVGRVRAAGLLCAGLAGQKRRCLKHVRERQQVGVRLLPVVDEAGDVVLDVFGVEHLGDAPARGARKGAKVDGEANKRATSR